MVTAMVLPTACRKQEAPAPAKTPVPAQAKAGDESEPVTMAAKPSATEAPPPDFGMPYDVFVGAQVLRLCAEKFHEDPDYAETAAVNHVLGKKFPVDLDHVFDAVKAPAKPGVPVKKEPLPPDTPDQLTARNKLRFAANLAQAHTETQLKITGLVADCLYAHELGIVDPAYVERYSKTFVEIACLQRQFTDAAGKFDALGHANAAGTVFAKYGMNAGELSRLGIVLGRFASVQAQVHKSKAALCPDPRVAEEAARTTGEWNGQVKGDRNGSLQLHGNVGKVKGAVQWLGATVKYADGAAENQAIPVEGQISGDRLALYGEFNGDWIRFEGKGGGAIFSGTWQAQRGGMDKFKGTFAVEKVPAAAAPGDPTAAGK